MSKVGDLYINNSTWDIFIKEVVSWKKIGNLKGGAGAQGNSIVNRGVWQTPTNYNILDAISYEGSMYLCIQAVNGSAVKPDVDTPHWTKMVSKGADGKPGEDSHVVGPPGQSGTDGSLIFSMPNDPTTEGTNNDFWVNSITGDIFTKSANTWNKTGNIKGAVGPQGIPGLGLNPRGVWLGTNTYAARDIVTYLGSLYQCSYAVTSIIPPNEDSIDWIQIVSKGDKGESIKGDTGAPGKDSTVVGPVGPAGRDGTGFTPKGTWSSTTQYTTFDIVTYEGSMYDCITPVKSDTAPDVDNIHWLLQVSRGQKGEIGQTGQRGEIGQTGQAGEKGADGLGLVPRGVWSAVAVYTVRDIVTYNGSGYQCIVNTQATQTTPETDVAHWLKFVSKGDKGDKSTVPGEKGEPGKDGTSLTPKGVWLTGTSYLKNDIVTVQGEGFIDFYSALIDLTPSLVDPANDAAHWKYMGRITGSGDTGEVWPMTLKATDGFRITDQRFKDFIFNAEVVWDELGISVYSKPDPSRVWMEWSGQDMTVKRKDASGPDAKVFLIVTFTSTKLPKTLSLVPPHAFKVQFDINHVTNEELRLFVTDSPTKDGYAYYKLTGLVNVGRQTYLTPPIICPGTELEAYVWNMDKQKMLGTIHFIPEPDQIYSCSFLPTSLEEEIELTAAAPTNKEVL